MHYSVSDGNILYPQCVICVKWASCEPKWATYNPWGFGALCGIVGKAATVTSGDCVWLLVTEAHGVHRLASAADDPLQRETRRHRQWIHFDITWKRNTLTDLSKHYTPHIRESALKLTPYLVSFKKLINICILVNCLVIQRLVLCIRCKECVF